jgi:putative solute:sodium symporter small subunit
MPDSNVLLHWWRTKRLMLAALGLWAIFSICVPAAVPALNRITVPLLDAPLGFLMASQGALVVFVIIAFAFARWQDSIDRDHFSDYSP